MKSQIVGVVCTCEAKFRFGEHEYKKECPECGRGYMRECGEIGINIVTQISRPTKRAPDEGQAAQK